MERNFLMSVSHELRTPLTAIRGHVAALREGVVEDPELEQQSLETVEPEAQRLERLVGDILDLAKLDTHRFTVTQEEVDMGELLGAGVRALPRRGAAAVDRLPLRAARPAGDRLRRRPRAADRRQPALERVPGDARRRPHLARARAAERHRPRRGRGLGPGHPAGEPRAALPPVRLGRRRRHRPRPARSRRSSRARSAAGSSSSPRSGKGSPLRARPAGG